MGVYTRFKKSPGGLRQLVELLEATPIIRRQKMIDVGMEEDPEYTQKALRCMMNFMDIIGLPDLELAEVIADTSPQLVGLAIHSATAEVKARFLRMTPSKKVVEVREAFELSATPQVIGGAQNKMIQSARQLEKRGIVKTKRILA